MSGLDLDALRRWEGREETSEDVITLPPVRALAATLDHDPEQWVDGATLPPLYHWLYFLQATKLSDLANDGHARKGAFMPPVPFPSRMFAGARVDYEGDLAIGERVRRVSSIKTVRYKEGRSGPLVFVTVTHRISNGDGGGVTEEQDIAYRPASPNKTGSAPTEPALANAEFHREIRPDERLLFRFSALTLNSHRIHYDLPYARSEGYPGLVVHGPLTAVLLADLLARERGWPKLEHFSFRARRALFLGDRIRLTGRPVDDTIELTALGDDGAACVTARAVLR